MLPRTVCLALSLSLALCADSVRAQGNPAPKEAKLALTLEQRLASLEEQAARMLTEIKAIRGQIKQGAPANPDLNNINIYRLKNLAAPQTANLLTELLNLNRQNKTLRVVADAQTNALIVAGKSEDQEIIRAIVSRLDEAVDDPALPKKEKR